MIEWAGLLYTLAKELGSYLDYDEEEKLVNFQWPVDSGFQAEMEKEGYRISWSRPEDIPTRQLQGAEVLYEVDKVRRIRYRLVLKDGLTLIGKKVSEDEA